jgi:hypothetical protein
VVHVGRNHARGLFVPYRPVRWLLTARADGDGASRVGNLGARTRTEAARSFGLIGSGSGGGSRSLSVRARGGSNQQQRGLISPHQNDASTRSIPPDAITRVHCSTLRQHTNSSSTWLIRSIGPAPRSSVHCSTLRQHTNRTCV